MSSCSINMGLFHIIVLVLIFKATLLHLTKKTWKGNGLRYPTMPHSIQVYQRVSSVEHAWLSLLGLLVPTLCISSEARIAEVGFLYIKGPSSFTFLTAAPDWLQASCLSRMSIFSLLAVTSEGHRCSHHAQCDPSASSWFLRNCRTLWRPKFIKNYNGLS